VNSQLDSADWLLQHQPLKFDINLEEQLKVEVPWTHKDDVRTDGHLEQICGPQVG